MKYIIYFFIFLCFWYKGAVSLDPDFGWHLRMGQIILSSGVPLVDPFSYSRPSYPFVDLSWLSGVFLAIIYPKFGMIGLSFVSALIAFSSLVIALSIKFKKEVIKNFYFETSLLLLGAGAILPFESVRIQVVSWFFLAIVFKIYLEQDFWPKRRFLLPGLFWLWANLHGSFAVGLLVLSLGILVRSWREKKLRVLDLGIIISSFLLTLVNPYGLNLYGEVARTLWGSNLSGKIMEWMPAIFNFHLSFVALIPLSMLSVYHYRNKYRLETFIPFFGFLAASIVSQRHIPLWIIICLPVLLAGYGYFCFELKRVKYGLERLHKLTRFVFFGCTALFLFVMMPNLIFPITENNFYPVGAVKYLKTNLPSGQIFSEYGWGGYLIWKLPEKKVFIDGRMCTWGDIMKESEAILGGQTDYRIPFNQYNIEMVLWPKSEAHTFFDLIFAKIQSLFNAKKSFSFLKEIEKDGWQKVYEDTTAVIYKVP